MDRQKGLPVIGGRPQSPRHWGAGGERRRGLRAAWMECIRVGTKSEHTCEAAVEMQHRIPDTLDELLNLERQVEREWWWLQGAISAVAQLQAERSIGDVKRFREMQAQARVVDRRRVRIAIRIAELAARRDAACMSETVEQDQTAGPRSQA
jgi:hypothetical protein